MSSLTDKAKSILTRLMEKASSTEASPQVEVEEPQTELLATVSDNNTSDVDGIHHINIWNNGKTELGRMLYQTANAPFSHPEFGHFASVLGFWQWLIEKNPDDELRRKYNGQIKKYLSRRGDRPTRFIANKEDIFFAINWMKIEQNQKIKEALLASTLPFKEYYYFVGKTNVLRVDQRGHEWVCQMFEDIRTMMKQGIEPEPLDWSNFISKE